MVIRAGLSGEAFTVTDSRGNTYRKAVQFNETGNGNTLGIFYAENIASGANTITVTDTAAGTLRFAILEYSGIATVNSLDVSVAAQGRSTAASSGNATTTSSGDLLLGAILTANPANYAAGSNYKIEENVPVQPNTKLMVEDQVGEQQESHRHPRRLAQPTTGLPGWPPSRQPTAADPQVPS